MSSAPSGEALRPLSPLPLDRELVVCFMVGDPSTLRRGYSHENAVIATLDYLRILHRTELDDAQRSLLASFALGVARGLGEETATLQALDTLRGDVRSEDAVEAYHNGVFQGAQQSRARGLLPG